MSRDDKTIASVLDELRAHANKESAAQICTLRKRLVEARKARDRWKARAAELQLHVNRYQRELARERSKGKT